MTNEELLVAVSKMIEQQTEQIQIIIENDVSKRINALADGYSLTHEKQWELERKISLIQRRLEDLEAKVI